MKYQFFGVMPALVAWKLFFLTYFNKAIFLSHMKCFCMLQIKEDRLELTWWTPGLLLQLWHVGQHGADSLAGQQCLTLCHQICPPVLCNEETKQQNLCHIL